MIGVNPRWLHRRRALHEAFDRICEPPDGSWLAYLGRHLQTWSTAEVAARWARADRDPGSSPAVNHVYLHVPFCKSICSFCNYERLQPRRPALLRRYEARVIEAIEQLAPSLRGIAWHTLYLGGGTPSVLPADQLRRIVTALDRHLDFVPNSSRYIELDPAVMSPGRLDALLSLGFHHFSFGIQTLQAGVNADHDRGAQGPEIVGQRFEELRRRDIHDVSCDFLMGLAGTTVEQILDEIRYTIATWRPTWIDVYMLTPTPSYLDRHFGGSRAAFDAHMGPFLERGPPGLAAIARQFGYVWNRGEGHALSLYEHRQPPVIDDDGSQPNVYGEFTAYTQLASEQDAPLHLLGLGTSARSRIFGQGWVEYRDPGDDIAADGPACWAGHDVDLRDDALCYLVHVLRDTDTLSIDRFRAVFGCHPRALFPDALAAWDAEGVVVGEDPSQVLLAPRSRRDRVRDLLWLVPEERLEWEIGRRLGISLAPEALAARLHPIGPGSTFGDWRIERLSPARLHLQHPDGGVALRLRPPLVPGRIVPDIVVEGTPSPASVDTLRAVVRILRRALGATAGRRAPA
ncbi:MAG: radical SAM protein [Deltaproteobacteria bacterium]|nr:MAG: radical SAM protein [Deltaproteobacteria bacterium]